jgi:outer membrane protein TolC
MWMIGLRQTLPPPGVRPARRRAARADAASAQEGRRARERDVVSQVKRAYWEYYRADRAWRVRRETIQLGRRLAELARISYEAGRGTQQDVLRTSVEVARLEADLATDEQAVRSAQVALNSHVGRDPDAALGPPPEITPHELSASLDGLEERLDARRPELASARQSVERARASLDGARKEASRPELMLGFDYGYMPRPEEAVVGAPDGGDHAESPVATAEPEMNRHFYTVMVGLNLPWLNPARRDDVRERERTLAAEERALESVRNAARFELRDAMARYHAARVSFDALDKDILPMARRSFESAQGAFGVARVDALGLLDALRSWLAVRLERARALAALEIALADLERAVGDDVATRTNPPEGPRS